MADISEPVTVRFVIIVPLTCLFIFNGRQQVLRSDNASSAGDQQLPSVELTSLSTRKYLDKTVVPILLDAMAIVAKERCLKNLLHNYILALAFLSSRPADPIEYLAAYLLKHKSSYYQKQEMT